MIGAAALLLLILLYYFSSDGKPHYSWKEHYISNSKDPYGTYLVRNLLEDYFPSDSFRVVTDSLGTTLDSGNFVYIGNHFWLDSMATIELLDFVAAGNSAFIATQHLPHGLMDSISGFECGEVYYDEESTFVQNRSSQADTVAKLNFEHPSLYDSAGYELKFLFLREPVEYHWTYFPSDYLCDSQTVFTPLGLLNDEQPYFVRANYGAGEFYLHTTPLAFTNLHLLENRGLEYASKVFSHLKPGTVYWDERMFDPFGNGNNLAQKEWETPLRYVLSQPSLAWAWYIMLGMALLYLVFRAKRRQRVIPVLEKNRNTSLEFIGTIGRLFFINNNHRQLADKKMRLFLIFVRERYHLPTKDLNQQFIRSLSIRSNIPEEHLSKILLLSSNISTTGYVQEETLVEFHRKLEKFYRECK
ncbi:MAG: DUF4350 domain-containing protein [Saprospiraceae bacterium]|nr:DUF4350 domain-containing protein [Saprospiraceae bacterium]